MENNLLEQEQINFTVDAGIINRLGQELVGRRETAVAELIKNAYDADATVVTLNFINCNEVEQGTLTIEDDGCGMNKEQLISGFMRIASIDKIENPVSAKYKRYKAGKKGIGRFATQFLGNKLTIITQTLTAEKALSITIDWDKYVIGQNIESIYNPISEIPKTKSEGTSLIINGVRDVWTNAQINRVFRYVSELLQPNYLSDREDTFKFAVKDKDAFEVKFFKTENTLKTAIADSQKLIFDRALAIIEGYVDKAKDAYITVQSTAFDIDEELMPISAGDNSKDRDIVLPYKTLQNVHFKAYYFIYEANYYEDMPKMELNRLKELSKEAGIRLYRNGFRVLPYGEEGNDWLEIDKTDTNKVKVLIQETNKKIDAYIPFGNRNFWGFVEVLDTQKPTLFEETASREGLIENEALSELKDFLFKSLKKAAEKINYQRFLRKDKKEREVKQTVEKTLKEEIKKLQEVINSITTVSNADTFSSEPISQEIKTLIDNVAQRYEVERQQTIETEGMLRVLAGLGLVIGEFAHEIRQFTPAFQGDISFLLRQNLPTDIKEAVDDLAQNFKDFQTYASYFDEAITQNTHRELVPLNLQSIVDKFSKTVAKDAQNSKISIELEHMRGEYYTCPMHYSEWTSILWNFYTNAKKAIRRARASVGKIKISCGEEKDKIYLEFQDNGDGIPPGNENKIFNAFFSTTTPASYTATITEQQTGTGLGLKIVKDTIEFYQGEIFLIPAESGYTTCFRIEAPKSSQKQLDEYGL